MMPATERTEDLILTVLAGHDVIPTPDGWAIDPATGGLNSRVYFLRKAGHPTAYTLRLSIEEKHWMVRHEAEILSSLAGGGCAPSGVALIEDQRLGGRLLLLHEFVAGSAQTLSSVTDARLQALGGCLAAIHTHQRDTYTVWPVLEPTRGNRAAAFLDRLAAMTRYATFTTGLSGDMQRRVHRLYVTLESIQRSTSDGWDETTFSLMHGDTSIGNIIWNGDAVTLIDWEYARSGDPAEELAYVLAEQPLSARAKSVLWESYVAAGGSLSAVERAGYYAPLVALDSVLWWGDYHLSQGRDPSTSIEVAMHLGRAEEALKRLPLWE